MTWATRPKSPSASSTKWSAVNCWSPPTMRALGSAAARRATAVSSPASLEGRSHSFAFAGMEQTTTAPVNAARSRGASLSTSCSSADTTTTSAGRGRRRSTTSSNECRVTSVAQCSNLSLAELIPERRNVRWRPRAAPAARVAEAAGGGPGCRIRSRRLSRGGDISHRDRLDPLAGPVMNTPAGTGDDRRRQQCHWRRRCRTFLLLLF
jgi:hypothetical protein